MMALWTDTMTPNADEPVLTLPTSVLVWTVVGVAGVVAAGWLVVCSLAGWGNDIVWAGPAAGGVVGLVGTAGVLIMTPWKERDVSMWMTMWLGATVLRMLVTPVLTILLYSATSLDAMAMTAAVALTYLVVLLSEAGVLARFIQRTLTS